MRIKYILIFYFLLCIIYISYSQSTGVELSVQNYSYDSTRNITVKIYPISMIFNELKQYNLVANRRQAGDRRYDYNNGRNVNSYYWILRPVPHEDHDVFFELDGAGGFPGNAYGSVCHGKWRIDIWWENTYPVQIPDDYVTIEYDAYLDAGYTSVDLDIRFKENADSIPTLYYRWIDHMSEFLPVVDHTLEIWHQSPTYTRDKNFGNFIFDAGSEQTQINNYSIIPQDPRRDCVIQIYPNYPNQNHFFDQSGIGTLTLNLTIVKNALNGNPIDIKTPDYLNFVPYDEIPPSPIIITDGATLTLEKGANNLERKLFFKKITSANLGTNLFVENYGELVLKGSSNSLERAHIIFENYSYSEFAAHSSLTMMTNSLIDLRGNCVMKWLPNTIVTGSAGSKISIYDNAKLINCGNNTGGVTIIDNHAPNGYQIVNDCSLPQNEPFTITMETGSVILVDENASVDIGNNISLIFDGSESFIELETGSALNIGYGSTIIFRNGAYLSANGCSFTSLGESGSWDGLIFENAGPSTITNCTFTGAETYLDFTNTTSGNAENNITVTGSTFSNGNVKIQNTTNCLISGNVFNSAGLFFNLVDISNTINLQPDTWSLNITDNQFTGGLNQIKLVGLAGNVSPFYVNANTFNGSASMGLWGTNISGSFKNNNFTSADYYVSFDLISSDMDVYNNNMYSNDNANVYAVTSSVKLAPVLNENNELVWYGGLNELNSANSNNLYFSNGSNAYVDNGNNCFTVQDDDYYHITGSFSPCFNPTYNAVRNKWNTDPPLSNVLCDGFPSSFSYIPVSTACLSYPPAELTVTGTGITDMGNGIYDTVLTTINYGSGGDGGFSGSVKSNELNTPPVISPDKILYSQALLSKRQKDYSGSITASKNIIDNYDSSKYLVNALDILFISYQYSDTIAGNNQSFTQLKEYLAQKIQQYENNTRFTDKAYSYYLKSVTKLKQYTEAIAGYENIMNNHPDPVVRLSASWERAAIILLMGTGGKNEKLVNDESIEYRKFIKKLFDNNPAHNIAKSNYREQKKQIENNDRSPFTKDEKTQIENLISKFDPADYKELAKRSEDDYLKMLKIITTHEKTSKVNQVPKRYKLYQNYPNPFNPNTTITFDLPKDIDIRLTVYDVLGREIYNINEFRKSGSNKIEFDGTNLASGVYYYSLEAGTFAETKKMVLIK